jgi:hypothetical protein
MARVVALCVAATASCASTPSHARELQPITILIHRLTDRGATQLGLSYSAVHAAAVLGYHPRERWLVRAALGQRGLDGELAFAFAIGKAALLRSAIVPVRMYASAGVSSSRELYGGAMLRIYAQQWFAVELGMRARYRTQPNASLDRELMAEAFATLSVLWPLRRYECVTR